MRLVISDNEGAMAVVPLVRDEISIGRKEGNTIRLTERNVSRQHCRIQRVNGSFVIRDLNSYNGVLVNGQRIQGEASVQPGDEVRVGDYTLVLEGDPSRPSEGPLPMQQAPAPAAALSATPASGAPPVAVAPELAPLQPPPRLVVLTPPLAGAEYSLPERGELRIGRSPDLDISIDHRSVSREHAKIICSGGAARILDLGSVNGVVINGQKVKESVLNAGDGVELGDITLRFVGAGQTFVFDPASVGSFFVRKRGVLLAGAILVVSFAIAIAIVQWSRAGGSSDFGGGTDARPDLPAAILPDPTGSAIAAPQLDALREACRKANQAERFAEAVAKANAALKLDPDDTDAQSCARTSRANLEQEQVFVRAKAALDQGDEETAFRELQQLSGEGPVAARPDVIAVVTESVQARIDEARELLPAQPDVAAELARDAAAIALVPEPLRAQARALVAQAESAPARSSRDSRGVHKRASMRETARGTPVDPNALGGPPPKPGSALDQAHACLVRGDSLCVIRALNGRAETAQELGLLIETYRALGNVEQAYRLMNSYIQRFPSGKNAEAYRQLLRRAPR